MFSNLSKTKILILANFILSSAQGFNLEQSRILSFGKELTQKFSKFNGEIILETQRVDS